MRKSMRGGQSGAAGSGAADRENRLVDPEKSAPSWHPRMPGRACDEVHVHVAGRAAFNSEEKR
jgi:hypothetical protein